MKTCVSSKHVYMSKRVGIACKRIWKVSPPWISKINSTLTQHIKIYIYNLLTMIPHWKKILSGFMKSSSIILPNRTKHCNKQNKTCKKQLSTQLQYQWNPCVILSLGPYLPGNKHSCCYAQRKLASNLATRLWTVDLKESNQQSLPSRNCSIWSQVKSKERFHTTKITDSDIIFGQSWKLTKRHISVHEIKLISMTLHILLIAP